MHVPDSMSAGGEDMRYQDRARSPRPPGAARQGGAGEEVDSNEPSSPHQQERPQRHWDYARIRHGDVIAHGH